MKRFFSPSAKIRLLAALGWVMLLGVTCIPAAGQQQVTSQARRASPASTNKKVGDVDRPLDGAWRLVSALDPASGQLRAIPGGIEMTKLIVGGRFAWIVAQNGRAVAGAGGTYTVAPDGYSETVSYAVGQNQQALIGTATRFTWRFEGGKWHHKGTLRVGQNKQEIDELWERIPDEKK